MAEYVAPLKDMKFVLKHVVGLGQVNELPGWEEVTEDLVDAILEEAGKLASELLLEEYRATYGLRTVVNRCGVTSPGRARSCTLNPGLAGSAPRLNGANDDDR